MKNKTINISVVIGLLIIIIINLMIIFKPFRIYNYETSYNITNDYSNTIAVNIENASGNYESGTDIPTSGYVLNTTESFCGTSNGDGTYTHDTSITMNYHDGVMFFGDMSVRKTKCFLYFDVDSAPVINSVSSSVTTSTITVTVDATDDIGISKYYYQIDSNSVIESTSNTYTFTGLSSGTSYTINIYVTDTSENKSSTYSNSISTTKIAKDTILANNTLDTSRSSGSFSAVFTEDTAGRIFQGPADDYGSTTYFFAGANPNNWVKFAGYYWRIIRINGDGTVRLIYNGTGTDTTGTATQLSSISAFNSSHGINEFVGYMYTYDSVHGLGTSSTIKRVLDSWYSSKSTNFTSYIDTNVGFCGDRQPSTTYSRLNGSGGTGSTNTYYGAYIRAYSTHQFTYKCAVSSDLYTTSSSSYGNKALTYPIGLITMDEVAFAGGKYDTSNSSYWLYTGQSYWTMSPSRYDGADCDAYVFSVYYGSIYAFDPTNAEYGVRPVINLKSDAEFNGSGTSSDPFVIKN